MITPNFKNFKIEAYKPGKSKVKKLKNVIKLSANESALGMSPKAKKIISNKNLNLDIPESEEYETLAGYVLNYFENIPKIDEIIDQDEFKIIIKEVDDRSVIKILLQIKN